MPFGRAGDYTRFGMGDPRAHGEQGQPARLSGDQQLRREVTTKGTRLAVESGSFVAQRKRGPQGRGLNVRIPLGQARLEYFPPLDDMPGELQIFRGISPQIPRKTDVDDNELAQVRELMGFVNAQAPNAGWIEPSAPTAGPLYRSSGNKIGEGESVYRESLGKLLTVHILLMFVFIGIITIWFALIHWRLNRLIVTDRMVSYKRGGRSSNDIPVNRIDNIHVHRSLWDRMFGCGTLIISAGGGVPTAVKNLGNVEEARQDIEARMMTIQRQQAWPQSLLQAQQQGPLPQPQQSQQPQPAQQPAPSVTPAVSVADELAKLAGLLQQGLLTQAEFDAQKARLLGSKSPPVS